MNHPPLQPGARPDYGDPNALFFRQLSDAVGSTLRHGSSLASSGTADDKAMVAALWDLVWAGRLSNDTLAPLRALTSGGRTAHRSRHGDADPHRTPDGGRPLVAAARAGAGPDPTGARQRGRPA